MEKILHIKLILRYYIFLALFIFLILAFFARTIPYFPIDLEITWAIQNIHNPIFSQLMILESYLGFAPQSLILVGIVCTVLYVTNLRWEALIAGFDALSISLIGSAIKIFVGRPRPAVNIVHVAKYLDEKSFPSGHVLFYTAFFGFLWYLCYRFLAKRWYGKLAIYLLSLLIILGGPSRIYLGQHWASDVIGAYLLGSVWLLVTIYVYKQGKQKYQPKTV